MDVKERIEKALKEAMKAQDRERTSVLRMLLAEIRNADAESEKPDYIQAVKAYAKRLSKATEEYERLGVASKVEELKREMAIVEEFLPRQLSEEELSKVIEEIIAANQFTKKDFGRAMKALMDAHREVVNGKLAARIIGEKLPA